MFTFSKPVCVVLAAMGITVLAFGSMPSVKAYDIEIGNEIDRGVFVPCVRK